MSAQTIIKYQDTALPTTAAVVTLFNSVTAFPPGKSFHLLGQQWFQYSLLFDSAGDAATGVVTGAGSNDGGVTWDVFYTSAAHANAVVAIDEVYVGMYQDVRFQLTTAVENMTVFRPHLALQCNKATSKVTEGDVLVDG
jgi:hypothetical protein